MNALLLMALLAPSGWGPGGCVAVAAPVFAPAFRPVPVIALPAPMRVETPEEAVERVLRRRAARNAVGCINPCDKGCPCKSCGDLCYCFRPDQKCDEAGCCCKPMPSVAPVTGLPTGVTWDRIGKGYSHAGRPCSRAEAVAAIEGSLVDDSTKPYFVVVGPDDLRKPVLADLASSPLLTPLVPLVRIQAYPAGHWAVTRAKIPGDGLWLVKADGTKLGSLPAYTGPEALAKLLKKADPNAPPEPAPKPPLAGGKNCWALWACAGLLAAILFCLMNKPK